MEVDLTHWTTIHDIQSWLLPFARRKYSPTDAMIGVQDLLSGTRRTQQDVKAVELEDYLSVATIKGLTEKIKPMFEFFGSFKREKRSSSDNIRFSNPGYIHDQTFPDDELAATHHQRLRITRRLADFGFVDRDVLAHHFNTDREGVDAFLEQNNVPWQKWRQEGVERMIRTVETAYQWGVSYEKLADALDVRESRLHDLRGEYGFDEWAAPEDPTALQNN